MPEQYSWLGKHKHTAAASPSPQPTPDELAEARAQLVVPRESVAAAGLVDASGQPIRSGPAGDLHRQAERMAQSIAARQVRDMEAIEAEIMREPRETITNYGGIVEVMVMGIRLIIDPGVHQVPQSVATQFRYKAAKKQQQAQLENYGQVRGPVKVENLPTEREFQDRVEDIANAEVRAGDFARKKLY